MTYPRYQGGGDAGPDPYGQAAILLIESLIHGLLARGTLTRADVVEIVETALEVKAEIGIELGDTAAGLSTSLTLLQAIRDSLIIDSSADEKVGYDVEREP